MTRILAAFAALVGCTSGDPDPSLAAPIYVETGDLEAISERGYLRILVPRPERLTHLPRGGVPLDHEIEMAEELAESLDLLPAVIPVPRHDRVLPALRAGDGDLAVASLTRTAARERDVRFSLPLTRVRERLVQRADEAPISEPGQLSGRRIVVRRSSSYWETAQALAAWVDDLEVVASDEAVGAQQLLYRVARGDVDLTIVDGDVLRATRRLHPTLVSHLAVSEPRPVGWAMRPDCEALAEHVDAFLEDYDMAALPDSRFTGDLDALKERGVLRLLTRNSAATYFLHRGELMGFEYELWRDFAERHGMRLQVVVPPSRDKLLPWLKAGKGDLVGAGLTITKDRLADPDVRYSEPYHEAAEVVVQSTDSALTNVRDLAGREVAVRPSSAYRETLEQIVEDGVHVKIVDVGEDVETEVVLRRVAEGTYDLAVADSHILDIERAHGVGVTAAFEIRGPRPHGVAVRADDTDFLAALDAYIEANKNEKLYRILHDRYFDDPRRIVQNTFVRSDRDGTLSPFDDLVREHADAHGLDWRLVTAQMYQESRFDPEARSWAGARGLMQLMPRTARELGVTDPEDPAQSIEAGVTYLERMRERFDDDLVASDRTFLALAAYNAGYGHVSDARRLAARKGWDSGRWFDNVERAMLLLMKPRYARRARHGYVRGTEPVHYVATIRDRFQAYRAAQ